MGKTLTAIIIVLLVIWGVYYVLVKRPALTTTANGTYASSTFATTSDAGMIGSSTIATGTSSAMAVTAKAVDIRNYAYAPAVLTVKVGTKVTWENYDTAPHTVTSVTGSTLNSPKLAKGESYSYTFTKAGTYNYYCTVHPNMKASIVVTE